MTELIDTAEKSKLDESKSEKVLKEEQLDRDAAEAAGKAGKTENRYDSNHDIFTK